MMIASEVLFSLSKAPHDNSSEGKDAQQPSPDSSSDSSKKKKNQRRGKLPADITVKLKHWLFSHPWHPYPSEEEKTELSAATGLTILQVPLFRQN